VTSSDIVGNRSDDSESESNSAWKFSPDEIERGERAANFGFGVEERIDCGVKTLNAGEGARVKFVSYNRAIFMFSVTNHQQNSSSLAVLAPRYCVS